MRQFFICLIVITTILACNQAPNKSSSSETKELQRKSSLSEKEKKAAKERYDSLITLSLNLKWAGQNEEKLSHLNECISIAQNLNNDSLLASVYLALSGYFDDIGDYILEIELLNKAIENFEATQNYMGCATVFNNMSWAYIQAFDSKKGIEKARNGISFAQKISDDSLKNRVSSFLFATMALAYLEDNQPDSALKYNKLALDLLPFVRRGKINQSSWLHSTFGNIYALKKQYPESEISYKKVLEYKDTISAADAVVFTVSKYCRLLNSQKRYHEAIALGKEGLNIARKTYLKRYQIDIADEICHSYEKLHQLDSAFAYSKIASELRDDVFNVRKSIQLQTLSFSSDLKSKELKFEIEKAKSEEKLLGAQRLKNIFLAGFVFVLVFAGLFFFQRNKIRAGKIRSDELLLNILPEEVAEELKVKGKAVARHFDQVTVMFTDFKGFTQITEKLSPQELVHEIHTCFMAFDHIIDRYKLEKIKTIGDSYMCVGGLPVANQTHAIDVVNAGLEIKEFIDQHCKERIAQGKDPLQIRIGIHSGPVVAGIVGVKKFAYDIWGDTVNTASRMESSGEPGKVNISGTTHALIKDQFKCAHRGKIHAKNKGDLDMYFVEGRI